MASLAGQLIKESYKGILKTTENVPISGSSTFTISDGEGNLLPLILSTGSITISGSNTTGSTTIQGSTITLNNQGLLYLPSGSNPTGSTTIRSGEINLLGLPPRYPNYPGQTIIFPGDIEIKGPGGITILPGPQTPSPSLIVTGSLSISGSVFFTGLIPCTSSNYVLGYNPITGRVCYTASCCPGGGGDDHPVDITGSSYYTANAASNTSGFSKTYGLFLGFQAGYSASSADYSNFIGYQAGYAASGTADYSNFIGYEAGTYATNAQSSNFIGSYAGLSATNANASNFIGDGAGEGATNANSSNFIGYGAGKYQTSASRSTIIGYKAGDNLALGPGIGSNNIILGTNISLPNGRKDSINIGGILFGTGSYSTIGDISYTGSAGGKIGINVISPSYNLHVSGTVAFPNLTTTSQTSVVTINPATGQLFYTASSAIGGGGGNIDTGSLLVTASVSSNTITFTKGDGSTFPITVDTGSGVVDEHPIDITGSTYYSRAAAASTSNFNNSIKSIFIGENAGADTNNIYFSTFLNYYAGYSASGLWEGSNFIGYQAGAYSDVAGGSNILGNLAGMYSNGLRLSNVLGTQAGYASVWSAYSNFLGSEAGANTYQCNNSNYLGSQAGSSARGCGDGNFFGTNAGRGAQNSFYSNFIGNEAGEYVTNAQQSNFIGTLAGSHATNAYISNFIGNYAGNEAYSASYSNFIGSGAGRGARNASFSTLIGYNVAYKNPIFYPTSIGRNNIIIGHNITLPNNTQDSINLGSIIFATGSYFNDPVTNPLNPYSGSMAEAKVGITVVNPTARLHIGASTTTAALMRLEVGPAPTSPNDGDIWLESNTDTGLKIRINGVTKTITLS